LHNPGWPPCCRPLHTATWNPACNCQVGLIRDPNMTPMFSQYCSKLKSLFLNFPVLV
jgi:hypothetical protein